MADSAPRRSQSPGVPPSRQSTGLTRRSASSVSFQAQRRQSSSDRINEILENARERAETMGAGTVSLNPPRAPGSPVLGRHTSSVTIPEDGSADERTGIVAHGSDLNYQSFQQTQQGNGLRPRKSVLNNRRSQPTPATEDTEYPSAEDQGSAADEREKPWWKATFERFQSVELENKGSVARDHLAIERTFLAWLRTSLAFASIGIAVTQLFRLNTSLDKGTDDNMHRLRHMGKPLGTTFLGISILTLFLGYKRYFQSQEWVMRGKFPASRGTVTIVAFMAFGIMVASLVVVIAIQPSSRP